MEEIISERIDHVRPLTFGEILDMTFRIYKNRFASILVITLLLCGPFYFLNEFSSWLFRFRSMEMVTEWDVIAGMAMLILFFIVITLIGIILLPLWLAAVTGISAGAFLRNESFTWIEGLRLAGKHGAKSILTCLLLFAIGAGGALIFFIPLFLSIFFLEAAGTADWVLGMLAIFPSLIFTLFALYVSIRLSLIFPVMIEEGIAYFKGLKRSWALTKSSFWRTFGLMFILIVLEGFITSIPSSINQALWVDPTFQSMGIAIIITLTTTFFLCLTAPLKVIALVLVYADRRARREGFDLEQRVARMETLA